MRDPPLVLSSLPGICELRVLDLGRGLAAGMVAKMLADMGAQVRHPVSSGDADPAQTFWRRNDGTVATDDLDALLAAADICILGGEPQSPDSAPDARALAIAYPRLILVELVSGIATPQGSLPAVELLTQAACGAVFEQEEGQPFVIGCPIAGHGCALQAMLGLFIALIERLRTGRGQVVTSSLLGGLAMFWAPFWMTAEHPDAGFDDLTPRGVRQLILRASDGAAIQIVLGVAGALGRLHRALDMPPPASPHDRGLPDIARGARDFFGDLDLFNRHAARWTEGDLLARLRREGIPAEPIRAPGDIWQEPQLVSLGVLRQDPKGVTGVGPTIRMQVQEQASPAVRIAPGPAPLSGVKVVDLGKFVAGPYASRLLADFGADVTAVIAPDGLPTLSGGRTMMAVFRGKRLEAVDAKTAAGRQRLHQLCGEADMVLDNFRPGATERLGISPADLRRDNPGVITLSTTAYGATGPRAGAPGFDMTLQAWSGLQWRNGGTGRDPLWLRTPLIDFAAGALGAIGLLAGLYVRRTTGRSVDVATSLLEAGLHLMADTIRGPDGTIAGPPALRGDRRGFGPAERLYRARDGWIALAVRTPAMARAVGAILGVVLPADPATWNAIEESALAAAVAQADAGPVVAALSREGVAVAQCVADGWQDAGSAGPVVTTAIDPVFGRVRHCLDPLVALSDVPRSASPPLGIAKF